MGLTRLIIVRFSIRNHRWKAKNLLYHPNLSDLVLQSRSAPLFGRLRYVVILPSILLHVYDLGLNGFISFWKCLTREGAWNVLECRVMFGLCPVCILEHVENITFTNCGPFVTNIVIKMNVGVEETCTCSPPLAHSAGVVIWF